jgi:TDG/mug DNA glycosylase family protein
MTNDRRIAIACSSGGKSLLQNLSMVRRSNPSPTRPTAADLKAAYGRTIPDLIAPGLDVLFCGINPGLYSAATGHHFARPGNRFWPALHAAGFTPVRLQPWQKGELLASGCGVTNLVARGTVAADELTVEELRAGRRRLERKVRRYQPTVVAVVGIGAYQKAFDRPKARLGLQDETIAGAPIWVLPNTSGLNANHRPADFAAAFTSLKDFVTSRRRARR